jgi:predicted XRE-type DNA-binding protein
MTTRKDEPLEIVRGSGNIFRDFGDPNPDLEQLRAILAARILRVLDERKLSVRAAQKLTGFAAADFSRVRNVDIGRFTIDRLMKMLDRLGQDVNVTVKVHPRTAKRAVPRAASRTHRTKARSSSRAA